MVGITGHRRAGGRIPPRYLCHALERRVLLCSLPHDYSTPPIARVERAPGEEQQMAAAAAAAGTPDIADIIWVNRGSAADDSDGFNAVFGANANSARNVVDWAIISYEQAIESFNYDDGSVNFDLTVEMGGGMGLGGFGGEDDLQGGKPDEGSLTLNTGTDGAGAGWFIDPTPWEHSEFMGTIVNAFSGFAPVSSPVFGLSDFYTVAVAEIAHALGLGADTELWNNRNTDTTIPDNAEGGGVGSFYVFNGPSIQHLMTSNNAGPPPNGEDFGNSIHSAGVGGNINFNGINWRGAEDAGNASYEGGNRYLVPDTLMLMFQDAYSYSIAPPQTRQTFYSLLNDATGQLVVRNGPVGIDDIITISQSGGTITVSVDVGTDVAGTGSLPGAGNLPPFVGSFNASQVSSILVQPGGGDDTVIINSLGFNEPVTIEAANGNDTLVLAQSGQNLDAIDSNITFDGGTDNDSIVLMDNLNPANGNLYTINEGGGRNFDCPDFSFLSYSDDTEDLILHAGSGHNSIRLDSSPASVTTTINPNGGNDFIDIALLSERLESVAGPVIVNGAGGAAGFERVWLWDSLSTTSDNYLINDTNVQHIGFGGLTYSGIEEMNLSASGGHNIFTINATAAGTEWLIRAGAGDDLASVSSFAADLSFVAGAINFQGGADNDEIRFHDEASTASDVTSVSNTLVTHAGAANVTYGEVETLQFFGGSGGDSFNLTTTQGNTDIVLNGNGGDDAFNIFPSGYTGIGLNGDITLSGGDAADAIFFNDHGNAFANSAAIDATSFVRSFAPTYTYSGVEDLTYNGGSNVEDVIVNGTPAGTDLFVNGHGGDDRIHVGGLLTGFTLDAIDGPLFVQGDDGADTININDQNAPSAANSAYGLDNTTFARSAFPGMTYGGTETVVLNASGGINTISLGTGTGGPSNVTINANAGNDTFQVDPSGYTVTVLGGGITLNGGAGVNDAIHFNDQANTLTTQGGISDTTFGRTFTPIYTYGTVESLTYNAGSGVDNIAVLTTHAGTPTTVNTGGSNDQVQVGPVNGHLTGIDGPLTVNGGAGSDILTLNDRVNIGQYVYNLTNTTFVRTNLPTMTYAMETVNLNTTNGNNTIDLATGAGGPGVNIDAGDGNDTFNIDPSGYSGFPLGGAVVLHGGADDNVDVINFNDQANASAGVVASITAAAFSRTFSPTYSYAAVNTLTYHAGSGGEEIVVTGTPAGTAVVVNAGGGNDIVHVGGGPFDTPLDAILGPVTVNGQADSDTLNYNDASSTGAHIYTVTPTILTRSGGGVAGTTYGSVELVQLRANAQANTIRVFGTAAGVPVSVWGNGGTDTIDVTETNATAPVTVTPSTGDDDVIVNNDGGGAATVLFDASQQIGQLSIFGGGLARLTAGGAKLLRVTSSITIAGGRLDLADNDLLLDYSLADSDLLVDDSLPASPAAGIEALVRIGYNVVGDWLGNGITSSVAANDGNFTLAVADNAQLAAPFGTAQGGPLFAGQDVDLTTVLVKFTHRADINLDGLITPDDAAIFGTFYDESITTGFMWAMGDLDYDGLCSPTDAAIFGTFYDESLPLV